MFACCIIYQQVLEVKYIICKKIILDMRHAASETDNAYVSEKKERSFYPSMNNAPLQRIVYTISLARYFLNEIKKNL